MTDEMEEQFWYIATWEMLSGEIFPLQKDGKITDLRYRWDRKEKEYVIRFKPTDNFDIHDFFFYQDYYPDKYEDRRKWCNECVVYL